MSAGISYKLPTPSLQDDTQTSLNSDLFRIFCKPCRMQVLYVHIPFHQHCYEQHVTTEDKQSVGVKQLHGTVVNNLSDNPNASASLVPLVPCQSTLKEHCIVPQSMALLSAQCCHKGAGHMEGWLLI